MEGEHHHTKEGGGASPPSLCEWWCFPSYSFGWCCLLPTPLGGGASPASWFRVVVPFPPSSLSSKIDRTEYKKLTEYLLCLLPTSLQNNLVVRAPFAANSHISLGIKGGGCQMCREVGDALIA